MCMRYLATFLLSLTFATAALATPVKNGFDMAGALVPASAILPGGPPRDGIASIDQPRFARADAAGDLKPEDRVLGVSLNGQEEGLYFPVRFRAKGYHPKERVLGLEIDGHFKAYPFAELAKTGAAHAPQACPPSLAAKPVGEVRDRLGGRAITVCFDADHGNATVWDAGGEPIPSVVGFWFAFYAFHPDTLVYKAKPR